MKLNPERVDLVRRRLGVSKIEFAAMIGVDRKTIQRFESGNSELSDAIVNSITRVSGYPKEFFCKGPIETPSPDSISFRSMRSLTARPRDAALAAAAIAFELDDWMQARFELPPHNLPQMDSRSPSAAAIALRARWGIGVKPISNMINVLEANGVRVFSLSEEARHLDAYSFWRNQRPYVFLNTCKTAEHSRFDAAHELGHLVLHQHGGPKHRSAEDEAHAFASEFLMPSADLDANMPKVRSLNDLIRAKKRWGVSAAALNYALNHRRNKTVSDWNYRNYCIELNRIGRENEPDPMPAESSQIWAKVFTALWREGITLSHVAADLAVPERELSNLLFNIAATPRPVQSGTRPPLRVVG